MTETHKFGVISKESHCKILLDCYFWEIDAQLARFLLVAVLSTELSYSRRPHRQERQTESVVVKVHRISTAQIKANMQPGMSRQTFGKQLIAPSLKTNTCLFPNFDLSHKTRALSPLTSWEISCGFERFYLVFCAGK